MKKLIAILSIILFVSCTSGSKPCNTPVPAPMPAPTQEEILDKQKAETERKMFIEWWSREVLMIQAYFSNLSNTPVKINSGEIGFIDNYNMASMAATIIMSEQIIDIYIVFAKRTDKWSVEGFLMKNPPPLLHSEEKQQVPTTEIGEKNDYKF